MKFKRGSVDDEIPTASMADIAFLLIIYFMVTTTFAATRGIVDKFIAQLQVQLTARKVTLTLDAEARRWLAEHGCDLGSRVGALCVENERDFLRMG